ncbi:leupaxin-like isoform X2 [Pristis pectinata]|uniref:leupaxin-like isoform X2 n=1 Tax=Pristis pectinata TaxID=685728 RepID=UPI00223DCF31|nr:leupaxin-like isoform X2 [Pristis pectinata]
MDELDLLLAELEQTSVSDARTCADPSTLSGFDFLTAFATEGSSQEAPVDAREPKLLAPVGRREESSSVNQFKPVYFSLLDDSGGITREGERPNDGFGRTSAEPPPDGGGTTLLSPTSAARELDNIMADLAGVLSPTEPSPTPAAPAPAAAAKEPESSLDTMLGTLQSDLKRLGVSTGAKGICAACKKPILGTIVTAIGLTWHPEHFVCAHCEEEIGQNGFYERDGRAYCNKDYQKLFSPPCAYCRGPIVDKILTALDKTWHPEHFFCANCGDIFGSDGYHEKDGKAYCRKDYFSMFAPKCGCCARPVLDNYLSALNSVWHPECFVCRDCLTPFTSSSFFEVEGMPYCELHYHQRQGTLCSACQKPIAGRCIAAMGRKFHPEHFVCAFCLKQLCKGVFKENNDKPYCNACFNKLFL